MLINFPNQLTSEEEQLLKKIAKMKKKKKIFIEKKTQIKESQSEIQQHTSSTSGSSTSSAAKRTVSKTPEIDAKEAAKKLIQSGAIKLETENKSKGFKRSCSRKDDIKKTNLTSQISNESQQISYSSMTSSPNSFSSPNYGNKFTYSTASDNQYGQSPNYNRVYRRMNSFQNPNNPESPSQGPTPGNGMPNFPRFQKRPSNQFNQQHPNQRNGVSLFIKANNVNEELLRSIFSSNVSQVKILSIDVKTNFAFVSVETKEEAEAAIAELNGKTFEENLFSVSIARPRKQFQRNNNYGSGGFDRQNSYGGNVYGSNNYGPNNYGSNNNTFNNKNSNNNPNYSGNSNFQSGNSSDASLSPNVAPQQGEQSSNARKVINYDDI